MSRTLFLEVAGTPAPKGSVSGFVVNNKKTGKPRAVVTHSDKSKKWEKAIREYLSEQFRAFTGPVSVELWFFLSRPKTVTRPYPSTVPDLDKLERAVLDALATVWEDDSRVVDLDTHKRYADEEFPPGVLIFVQEKVDSWDAEKQYVQLMRRARREATL